MQALTMISQSRIPSTKDKAAAVDDERRGYQNVRTVQAHDRNSIHVASTHRRRMAR